MSGPRSLPRSIAAYNRGRVDELEECLRIIDGVASDKQGDLMGLASRIKTHLRHRLGYLKAQVRDNERQADRCTEGD